MVEFCWAEKDGCLWCVAELAGTVAGCIAGGWTGVGLVGCVSAAITTGHLSFFKFLF
jgi:hypothetical protein